MPYHDSPALTNVFYDIPWLCVPSSRLGNISIEPLHPPGVLLGGSGTGSGKPSKLAALAAARKKNQDQKKQEGQASEVRESPMSGTNQESSSVALLDKLSIRGGAESGDSGEQRNAPEAKPTFQMNVESKPEPRRYKRQKVQDEQDEPPVVEDPTPAADEAELDLQAKMNEVRAAPSMFASTLAGPAIPTHEEVNVARNRLPLPVSSDHDSRNFDPFAAPSPDDLVNNAQAKGSKRG